jgi:hypothetical protein
VQKQVEYRPYWLYGSHISISPNNFDVSSSIHTYVLI